MYDDDEMYSLNVELLCYLLKEVNGKIDLGATYEVLYPMVDECAALTHMEDMIELFKKYGREVKMTETTQKSKRYRH